MLRQRCGTEHITIKPRRIAVCSLVRESQEVKCQACDILMYDTDEDIDQEIQQVLNHVNLTV